MSPQDAAKLLELPDNATAEQIEARFLELRRKLEDKIAKAPTPGLQAKYRESLAAITTAFETLTLAADGSSLPVLKKESPAGAPRAVAAPSETVSSSNRLAGDPSSAPPSPVRPPQPQKKSSSKEFAIVAVVAVVVLAAGGWWVMKTKAENEEKARVATEQARLVAEQKAEAERQVAAAKAEQERQVAAEKEAAEAERIRLDRLAGETNARLANTRLAWEAVEQELRRTERRLTDLRGDERTLGGAARSPALPRLRAEIAAQSSFRDWLELQISRHPARALRVQAEALLSARQFDQAAEMLAQAVEAQASLEREIRTTGEQMLTLEGSVIVAVTPASATWKLSDAYGAMHEGRGETVLPNIPWGPVVLEANEPGYRPQRREGTLRRDEPLRLSCAFQPVTLRIDSHPQGAEIRLAGQTKGTTPATIAWPGDGELELRVRLGGHVPVLQKLGLASGESIDIGTLTLRRIPTAFTRPDFSRGPLRYSVSMQTTYNYRDTDNSSVTDDFVSNTSSESEQTVEIQSPTESSSDATGARITFTKRIHNGKPAATPGTVHSYTKIDGGWIRTLADGNPVPGDKDGKVPSPIEPRTMVDHADWWPREEKKVGESWSVPVSALVATGAITAAGSDQIVSATGRLLSFVANETQQVAEVEFSYQASGKVNSKEMNVQFSSSGRIRCTIDLASNFITALTYTYDHSSKSDSPVMLGIRLKSVTTRNDTESFVYRPL